MSKFYDSLIVCEATGGYEKKMAHYLSQNDKRIAVVNPRLIHDFGKAMGKLAKTDKIDSHVIALYGEKMNPRTQEPISKNAQELTQLEQRRRQIQKMIIMEKNHLENASPMAKKSINKIIKTLDKEMKAIAEKQQACIKEDEELSRRVDILRSAKGIGVVVSTLLVTSLPELGQISNKAISALVGVANAEDIVPPGVVAPMCDVGYIWQQLLL